MGRALSRGVIGAITASGGCLYPGSSNAKGRTTWGWRGGCLTTLTPLNRLLTGACRRITGAGALTGPRSANPLPRPPQRPGPSSPLLHRRSHRHHRRRSRHPPDPDAHRCRCPCARHHAVRCRARPGPSPPPSGDHSELSSRTGVTHHAHPKRQRFETSPVLIGWSATSRTAASARTFSKGWSRTAPGGPPRWLRQCRDYADGASTRRAAAVSPGRCRRERTVDVHVSFRRRSLFVRCHLPNEMSTF